MKRHRALSWLAVIIVLVSLTAPIGMAGAAPVDAELAVEVDRMAFDGRVGDIEF